MKKFFTYNITICLCLVSVMQMQAQTCTPSEQYNSPGIYPATLPQAMPDKYYEAVLHAVVPFDTNIVYNSLPVNVIISYSKVLSVEGLPAGFNYRCNNTDCQFLGATKGCLVIYGTASQSQMANYPLRIRVKTVGTMTGVGITIEQTDTVKKYSILVSDQPIAVPDADVFNNHVAKIIPNPATEKAIFCFDADNNTSAQLQVYNVLGKMIYEQQVQVFSGTNRVAMDIKNFKSGIYWCRIFSPDTTTTATLLVEP